MRTMINTYQTRR